MTTKNCRMFCLASLLMFASFTVFADSPKTIENPDSHSVEVKGKIKLYRVQVENMNLGEGKNAADPQIRPAKPGIL